MKDKTKEQLLDEIAKLRQKNAELEASESERKWAEQELRESQERYKSLTEASPVGIFHSDSQGDFLYVNERWVEIARLSPEEAYGKGWENALHPDDKKRISKEWYKSCQEKRPFKSEFRFQPSKGISVWVLCQSSVEKNANGEVIGYIGTITDITYRKQVEEALRKSEARYRTLFETSPDGIIIADIETRKLKYANPALSRMLGYNEEELKGMGVADIHPKEDLEHVISEFEAQARGEKTLAEDIACLKKDGTIMYADINSTSLLVDGKECNIGFFRDITKRKKAEEKLKAMNKELEATSEELRALNEELEATNEELESTNEELNKRTHDLGERIKELSCLYGIEEITGGKDVTIEEVLKGTVQLIPPSWQYPEITGCRITFKGKKYETSNFKETRWMQRADIIVNNRKDGEIEVCYLRERPESHVGPFLREERDLINAIAKRLGLFIERHQAEATLKSSEERLRILFEYAPDGYYLNDFKGNFVDGNRAAEELTGYKRDELIGKNFLKLKLLSPKEIPKAAAFLAKNALGQPTGPNEFTLRRKDGTQVVVEIRTFPVKIKGKARVLGNVRDITKRKQAEERLRASLEEKEILLKEIHHRVKNNMQIISSLLRIQAADIKDEKIQDMFNGIHDRIRSMAVLYEMLYQSKDMTKVDLSEYIRRLTTHLVSMYRAGLGPISLNLDVKDVHLDVKRAIPCGLIITELVSNTLKHAFPDGRKGEIAVEMHPNKGKKYTLVVKDDGVGIPEGLDFRETKSLGMKLALDLVKQINGTFELSKEKGTEFKIIF